MNKTINKNRLKISWIIPEVVEASGGRRNIFRIIKYLSLFGHELKVYVVKDTNRFATSNQVKNFIRDHYMDVNAEIILGTDNIDECDVLFATFWTTAYIVNQNRSKASLCCYLIQDYEPYFYPMGYEYVLAYNTYKMGFHHITSGPWCAALIEKEFNVKSDYFMFPIDRDIYYYNERNVQSKNSSRIIFFAKPDMSRRCYPIAVEALSIIKNKYPEVEIIFYGANKHLYNGVKFDFVNLGILPKVSDLGRLYRIADIGVAFSTTNPSLVPYEMMACGCPVVDLDFNNNEVNYGSRDNVMLVEPSSKDIAKGIEELMNNIELRKNIIKNGLKYCEIFKDEEATVKKIEEFIKNKL